MTTLVFLESRSVTSGSPPTVGLRAWLGGHWAILFSHPGDFDREQLERDRWLNVLSRSFSAHGMRAMAFARYAYDARTTSYSWLTALGDGRAAVLWPAPPAQGALLDQRASTLHAEIARSGPRFAMIIDSDLRCRRTMHYRVPVDLPSPIELLGWAVALRDRREAVSDSLAGTRAGEPCHHQWPCKSRTAMRVRSDEVRGEASLPAGVDLIE